MILKIVNKNKHISIHCNGYTAYLKHTFPISGVNIDVKTAIKTLGLNYRQCKQDNIIIIYKTRSFGYQKCWQRTEYFCKVSQLAIGERFYIESDGRMYIYEGNNKGYYMPDWGKEIVDFLPEQLAKPCADVPTKEIKVRLYSIDIGYCREMWQSESINKRHHYFGRDTADGHWCVLNDAPNGYYEPSYSTGPHFHFIVCDHEWNELFRHGNNNYIYPESFPSLEKVCKTEWESIKSSYPRTCKDGLQSWLEKFKPENLEYSDSINWSNRYEQIDPGHLLEDNGYNVVHESRENFKTEILHTFKNLGEEYHIMRYAHQHQMCEARWYVYMVVTLEKSKVESNVQWLAYEIDIKPDQAKV